MDDSAPFRSLSATDDGSECDSAHLSIVESRASIVGTAIRVRVWVGTSHLGTCKPFGCEVG